MFWKTATVKTGSELISDGMSMLTQATDLLTEGIDSNAGEIAANNAVIEELEARSTYLAEENKASNKIVANFKKNILGE